MYHIYIYGISTHQKEGRMPENCGFLAGSAATLKPCFGLSSKLRNPVPCRVPCRHAAQSHAPGRLDLCRVQQSQLCGQDQLQQASRGAGPELRSRTNLSCCFSKRLVMGVKNMIEKYLRMFCQELWAEIQCLLSCVLAIFWITETFRLDGSWVCHDPGCIVSNAGASQFVLKLIEIELIKIGCPASDGLRTSADYAFVPWCSHTDPWHFFLGECLLTDCRETVLV